MLRNIAKNLHRYYAPLALLVLGLSLVWRLRGLDQPASYIFDEDMHAYTAGLMAQNDPRAYEWRHPPFAGEFEQNPSLFYRPPAVEWLHPPLAKLFQATSIRLLGNTAFAWRLPSALAGVGVVWLVVLITLDITSSWQTSKPMLTKKTLGRLKSQQTTAVTMASAKQIYHLGHPQNSPGLFGANYILSLMAGLVAGFEPLLLVQSRLASADIFVTFFGLLTVWLYIKYFIFTPPQLNRQKTNWWPILLTGMSLGLTIASKWSGAFLILGLVGFEIVSQINIKPQLHDGCWLAQLPVWWLSRLLSRTNRVNQIAPPFHHMINLQGRLWRLVLICLVAGLVYLLSYSQMFLQGKGLNHLFELHHQSYWYQTHTTFTHPSQSRPWQWLVGQKPVWYYYQLENANHQPANTGQIKQIVAQPWAWLTILGFSSIICLNWQIFIQSKQNKNKFDFFLIPHQLTVGLPIKKLESRVCSGINTFYFSPLQTKMILFLIWITLSLYLPWFFISRALFIYQLTPIMPYFIILTSVSIFCFIKSGKIDLTLK
ncbi:MAG: phospholipid carrier-dependent glycosyltransferase [Patescibacteria group bacterium]